VFHIIIQIALLVRVLLRPYQNPALRLAWMVVIVSLPVVGILAYLVSGETNIGRQRVAHMPKALASLPDFSSVPGPGAVTLRPLIPERHQTLFKVGQFIGRFEPVVAISRVSCQIPMPQSKRS